MGILQGQKIECITQVTRADGTVEPAKVKAVAYTNPIRHFLAWLKRELPKGGKVARHARSRAFS